MTREQLDAIRARVDEAANRNWSMEAKVLVDARALLAEVERLTADPLPAAAWVREVERAAFQRGVAAMREAAARWFMAGMFRLGGGESIANIIRALPDPEDTE